MVLLKTINGTLSACNSFIMKMFFYALGIVLNKFHIS